MLGLAFKPDTNDVRDTPAVPIIEQLLAEGAQVNVHDPAALDAVDELFNGAVEPCPDLPQALEHVDAVLLVTRCGRNTGTCRACSPASTLLRCSSMEDA